MYFKNSNNKVCVNLTFSAILTLVFSIFINESTSHAQSYQKRQHIKQVQYQRYLQAKKRQRHQQRARQQAAKKQGFSLFGLGNAAKPRRRVYYKKQAAQNYRGVPVSKRRSRKKVSKGKTSKKRKKLFKKVKSSQTVVSLGRSRASKKRSSSGRRAMCVRLCDGFYWPVKKVNVGDKKMNAKLSCQNSCATPTRVYYAYDSNTDTAKTMRDVRGNRYSNLKNAFVYRKELKASCHCRPMPWTDAAQKVFDNRAKETDDLLAELAEEPKKSQRTAKLRASVDE